MNSVVVMPTAHRPEFLALALERLRAVLDCPNIVVVADYVSEKRQEEISYVVETYGPPRTALIFQPEHTTKPHSGTWNILQSLRIGYAISKGPVFLVEEDVAVFPHWKRVHDDVLATGSFVASCGRLRPATIKYYGSLYTNPGSCLTRELLDELMPHINDEYFAGTSEYLSKTFGAGGFGGSSLDDGLIRAVIDRMGGSVAYPDKPLCAHQGFKGYSLGFDIYANKGDIKQRIAGLREILARVKPGDRYCPDFEPFEY
jgi:hypothetical protein